jgi:hypothetical protein
MEMNYHMVGDGINAHVMAHTRGHFKLFQEVFFYNFTVKLITFLFSDLSARTSDAATFP